MTDSCGLKSFSNDINCHFSFFKKEEGVPPLLFGDFLEVLETERDEKLYLQRKWPWGSEFAALPLLNWRSRTALALRRLGASG